MNSSQIPESITFSILMANYNNSKFIEEAIESVLTQSYQYWELIIVDDCSTDNSIEIINKFLDDKRIKLYLHKKNLGYGGTLRTAATNASNKIIAILDPDDKLYEKALETIVKAYKTNPDCGFIYSSHWICDSNLKNCVINKLVGTKGPENIVFYREKVTHFKTFLMDVYKKTSGFDINQKRAVDKDLIFKLEEVTKFKFINVPLYFYRHHESGISQGENELNAILYFYIAKCKAYKRRLNTDFPNVTKFYLWIDYFKITLHRQRKLLKTLVKFLRMSSIIKKISNRLPQLIKEKLMQFK